MTHSHSAPLGHGQWQHKIAVMPAQLLDYGCQSHKDGSLGKLGRARFTTTLLLCFKNCGGLKQLNQLQLYSKFIKATFFSILMLLFE